MRFMQHLQMFYTLHFVVFICIVLLLVILLEYLNYIYDQSFCILCLSDEMHVCHLHFYSFCVH
jgi:hypothetical protein